MKLRTPLIILMLFIGLVSSVWLYSEYLRASACTDYESLDKEWRELVLKQQNETDVRVDGSQLVILGSFSSGSGPFVQKQSFHPSGAGWYVSGSLVDMVTIADETFFLYGKENECNYPALDQADHHPDWERTFGEVVLVKDAGGKREIVHSQRLGTGNHVYPAGLRAGVDSQTVEIIIGWNWPDFQVLYRYGVEGSVASSSRAASGALNTVSLSDHDEVEISRAISMIENCFDKTTDDYSCIGVYVKTCTTTQQVCGGVEASAWDELSNTYLAILSEVADLKDSVNTSQESWTKFSNDECSFVSNFWQNDRPMYTVETVRCTLTLIAERALILKVHVANLSQR